MFVPSHARRSHPFSKKDLLNICPAVIWPTSSDIGVFMPPASSGVISSPASPIPTNRRSPPRSPSTPPGRRPNRAWRSEEHTSELQSLRHLVCRLLLEKKKN